MKILIVGAGSIGVYLGTLLNQKHNVFLLGREKLKNINDTILIRDSFYQIPKRLYSFPKKKYFDFIFITSKSYDYKQNLEMINEFNIASENIISIQNGMIDNIIYQQYFKDTNFTSISIFEGFTLFNNKIIINNSEYGWKTDTSITGEKVSKLLSLSGIKCTPEMNFKEIQFEKLLLNCCVNAVSAIEKKTLEELFNNPKTTDLIEKIFNESYNVLNWKNELSSKNEVKKNIFDTVRNMKHYSSTYYDAISGNETEINDLNGYIVKLGKDFKIKTPINEKIIYNFYKKYPLENTKEIKKNINNEIKFR